MRLLAISGAICLALFGQGQYGSINGTISDTSGAVLPGAKITIVNTATGATTNTVAGADGTYTIPQVLPGAYDVTAEMVSFKKATASNVKVDINQNLTVDMTMELGATTETVTVSSRTQMLETVAGSVGHTVHNQEINELPLNGRNVFDLVNLTPGSFRLGGEVSIGGGRTSSAMAMLDGTMNSRGGIAAQGIEMNPPVDSMQEFRVEANSFSAQYGRSNAGIVNATTRGGSNEFHGTIYEFLRNDKLDSRGWNADEKAPLRRNQFGGTIGGRIVRNKTFFFHNEDVYRERRGVVRTRTVPLADWRQGDLSRVTRQVNSAAGPTPAALVIYDPDTGQRQPFANNRVPASRLDPVARKAVAFVPMPNRTPDNPITQGGNWQENSSNPTDRNYHTARIDHSLSDKLKVFGRLLLAQPDQSNTGGTQGFGVADTDAINVKNRRYNIAINGTYVISPSFFLTLRAGANRASVLRAGLGAGQNWPEQLGVNGVAPDTFPRFNMSNGLVPTTNFGTPGNQNRRAGFTTTEYHADFAKIRGSHNIKFGGDYMRFNANDAARQFASGQWVFNTRWTNGINANGATIAQTGMTFADFLLGRLNQVNAEVGQGNGRRSQYYAAYLEDAWRVSNKLTLTFGIRYELETPFIEIRGRLNNFDPWVPFPLAGTGDIPAGARGVITFPGRNGYGKRLIDWDPNNFSPRFGFNYRWDSQTVIRGGFGIFFGNPFDRNAIQISGLGFDGVGTVRDPVPFTLRQGLPPGTLTFPDPAALTSSFGARGTRYAVSQVQFLDPRRKTQYNENFSLTIQRQWQDMSFEFGYIGNLGRKITFPNLNINHIPPELLPRTEIPARLRRPFTQFESDTAQIQIISPNWGLSAYHAFTFKSEKRFSNGLGWIATYAWSKWIDNVIFTGGDDSTFGDIDQIQNVYDLRNERSLSTNHVPHRTVLSPIFEIPVGKGKRWLNHGGPLDWILGGWQLSGIATMQAGSPFGVNVVNGPRDILGDNSDGKNLRPNIVGSMDLPDGQKGTPAVGQRGIQWFNQGAFAVPARFTHGNAARTVARGPGFINFDTGVMKNFRIGERYRVQFRWESFNAFNTPAFGNPGSDLGGANFGIAGAGSSHREMQFAIKFYY